MLHTLVPTVNFFLDSLADQKYDNNRGRCRFNVVLHILGDNNYYIVTYYNVRSDTPVLKGSLSIYFFLLLEHQWNVHQ